MKKFRNIWLSCFTVWVIILEVSIYGAANHWHVNPWLSGNATFICIVGGIFLFVTGVAYIAEGIF